MNDEQVIKPVGSVLEVDKDGFLVREVSNDKIQDKWRSPVNMTVEAYQEHFSDHLHSIYIRGSVAKGAAMDNISDIDSVALVNLPKNETDLSWRKDFNQQLTERYPFVSNVEVIVEPAEASKISTSIKTVLTLQAVCVYGEDIIPELPKLKPGRETALHAFSIRQNIKATKEQLGELDDNAAIRNKCQWIMKRLVRTGCELVMERSQRYSRDLYPCYKLFSKYYPKKEPQMRKVLKLAIEPTVDKAVITSLLSNFGNWIVSEVQQVFD